MKLHEAIAELLRTKISLTTSEIAEELNLNGWYTKEDRSEITAFQIHGRTKNYSHIFKRNGIQVSLHSTFPSPLKIQNRTLTPPLQTERKKEVYSGNAFSRHLIESSNYYKWNLINIKDITNQSGIYSIKILDEKKLPIVYSDKLNERKHNLLYIGVAKKCLKRRFIDQELNGKGHGTFFRTLGAVLGFRPQPGSLITQKNQYNYKFNSLDNQQIAKWISENLVINCIKFEGDLRQLEKVLIDRHQPLFNLTHNKNRLKEIELLREICRQIAMQPMTQ